MKVCAIDDEFAILRKIKNCMEQEKWQVAVASNYEDAEILLEEHEFGVIICDYHISHGKNARQGLQLIKGLREQGIQTPVIFLTGKKIDEITPWDALNSGVDDFMKKPWRAEELVARVKAVVRRKYASEQNATNVIKEGNVALDLDLKKAFVGSEEVHLGNILFLLLSKFLEKPNNLLAYEDLINYIWGTSSSTSSREYKNTLRVHITHLKKVLGKDQAKKIRTVHGEGYVWEK